MNKIDVIYLNGGSGVRTDLGYPKQFARLKAKPILIYGLETLKKIDEIDNIIIPSHSKDKTVEILDQYNVKNCTVIKNGETRQQSVYNSLSIIKTDYVLIMEAVRPFCSENLIRKVLKFSGEVVIPRSYMYSTVILDCGTVIDRNHCGEVQMPQKYQTSLLFEAHKKAINDKLFLFTDDYAIVKYYNELLIPKVIKGEQQNIKITTPLDLTIAEAIQGGTNEIFDNNRE